MIRPRSEIVEKERAIIEALNFAREFAETAGKENNPCLTEAVENWHAEEEELMTLTQFKDATAGRIYGALMEVESIFLQELAEILSFFKDIKLADLSDNNQEMENLLSPAAAYDKEGKPLAPPAVNTARKRAFMLWRRKHILEWLLKEQ